MLIVKYFESQKYCVVEIGEKMRFVKNQLRLNWCLISLKRNLLRGFVNYLYLLRSNISRKKLDFFLYRKNMCWFDRTVQQNLKNVLKRSDLKIFGKLLFLISKFFFQFDWLKIKTKFKIIVVTFHPKLSANDIFDRADEVRCS